MRRLIFGVVFGLGVAGTAAACDGFCGRPIMLSPCGCAPVVCPPCPCGSAPLPSPAAPLAVPTPAPPSTPEPPLAAPAPAPMPPYSPEPPPATLAPPTPASLKVQSANPAFYDAYRVPARTPSERIGGRSRVSFWNLSGRDVVLRTGGQTRTLGHGRRVLLDLGRSFQWQIEGRTAETATVRPGDVGLELVIRR